MDLEYGTITVNGKDVVIFNNMFDFLAELDYQTTLTQNKDDIKEIKDTMTMPDVFIGEVTNGGDMVTSVTDETLEFKGKTYAEVDKSIYDEGELPSYLLASEFERVLFQVYVRHDNHYLVQSQNLFPTREAAEACMAKIKNPFGKAVNIDENKPNLSLDTIDLFIARMFDELTRDQLIALALYYEWEENVNIVTTIDEE